MAWHGIGQIRFSYNLNFMLLDHPEITFPRNVVVAIMDVAVAILDVAVAILDVAVAILDVTVTILDVEVAILYFSGNKANLRSFGLDL